MNQLTLTLFPKRAIFFCLSPHPPLLQCTHFSIQSKPRVNSPRSVRSERQSKHFLQLTVEVMNTQAFFLLALSLPLSVPCMGTVQLHLIHFTSFNLIPIPWINRPPIISAKNVRADKWIGCHDHQFLWTSNSYTYLTYWRNYLRSWRPESVFLGRDDVYKNPYF